MPAQESPKHDDVPVMLNLHKRPCLVVGGGEVAGRRIEALLSAGAEVTVISPEISTSLQRQVAAFTYVARSYRSGDINRFFLVVAATDCPDVNKQVYEESKQEVPLVNVVDNPELSTFYFPANVKRGKLSLSVSTQGASPILTKRIKKQLENMFGQHFEPYLDQLFSLRRLILEQPLTSHQKREALEYLTRDELLQAYKEGNEEEVNRFIQTFLKDLTER